MPTPTDPLMALIEAMTDDQVEALVVRLAPFLLPRIQIGAHTPDGAGPEESRPTSPYASISEVSDYLNVTRKQVEHWIAKGLLTPVKFGMPKNTPRSQYRSWPTRIKWSEVRAFSKGQPTGRVAREAARLRSGV